LLLTTDDLVMRSEWRGACGIAASVRPNRMAS
jgi:hypothetical protein